MDRRIAAGEIPLIPRTPEEFDAMLGMVFAERPFLPRPILHSARKRAIRDAASNRRLWNEQRADADLLHSVLDRLHTPTLTVWGDADRIFDVSGLATLKTLLPGQPAIAMAGVGHLPMMERPAETAGHHLRFLRDLGQGTRVGSPNSAPVIELCADRAGCEVEERMPAGRDGDDALEVWTLRFPENEEDACVPREAWLVRRGAKTATRQLLVTVCNDGYGAAGLGEDVFEVEGSNFRHRQMGGSNWRWATVRELSLSPLAWRSRGESSWWTLGPNRYEASMDFHTLRGRVELELPTCDEDGTLPVDLESASTQAFEHAPIPQFVLPLSEPHDRWKTTALGECALTIDASGEGGYLVHGAKGDPSDAAMKVALDASGVLFVEITDDLYVGPTARWLVDDHVELWLTDETLSTEGCTEGKRPAKQWGIRLADGKIFPAHGKPGPLVAEVHRLDDRVVRLRIELPAHEAFAVVYSDGDDGRTQERLLATSRLAFGDGRSLGTARRIPSEVATCELHDGLTRLRFASPTGPDRPLLHADGQD